jgi:hypothetical protein
MKRQNVRSDAITAMVVRSTKASARLESREVPAGHIRSHAVERYIAETASTFADASVSQCASRPEFESDAAISRYNPDDPRCGQPAVKDRSPIPKRIDASVPQPTDSPD